MSLFDQVADIFRGKAISVPPLDGMWRPNTALDDALVVATLDEPDNLVAVGDNVFLSSGRSVLELEDGGLPPRPVASFDTPVTALAALPDGGLCVGLDDGRIFCRGGVHDGKSLPHLGPDRLVCPVAMAALDVDTLIIAQGSTRHRPSDWVIDLMEKNAGGSLWRLQIKTGAATCLATGLAFPSGVLPHKDGAIVVAEAWAHRLISVAADGRSRPRRRLANMPGYPGRLAASSDGSVWLALFAPRNRLVEFVLMEDTYRRDMMREVAREQWIAPSLGGERSFLQPLQCGGVRTMGIHKAWAPSRSYGLVVRLDKELQPVASFHSRADGLRHGVTSVLPMKDRVLVASRGSGAVIALPMARP